MGEPRLQGSDVNPDEPLVSVTPELAAAQDQIRTMAALATFFNDLLSEWGANDMQRDNWVATWIAGWMAQDHRDDFV